MRKKNVNRSFRAVCLSFFLALVLTACGNKAQAYQDKYDLGAKYVSDGNYEEAIIAYTAAIKIDVKNPAAYLARGKAYVLSGETTNSLETALEDFNRAVELDETNTDAYLGLADVYIRRGEYDKALEVIEKAVDKTNSASEIVQKLEEMKDGKFIDSSGNLRRMNSYDSDGTLLWYHIYTYDQDRRTATATSYNANNSQTGHVDLVYDSNGRSIVNYDYPSDSGAIEKIEYDYDGDGKKVASRLYRASGDLRVSFAYQYNSDGKLSRTDQYDSDGSLTIYELHQYDANGTERRDCYYANGEYFAYDIIEYNDMNLAVTQRNYRVDGTIAHEVFKYYDDNGNYLGSDVFTYDENGNVIQSSVTE